MVESYAVNERMNQIVLEHLDSRAWRAKLPGSKGRTIAAIFSHVHNIRRKWLRLSAPQLELADPARSREMHAKAGQGCLTQERRTLRRDACGGSVSARPPDVSTRRVGEAVAGRRSDGGLHDYARRASSRPGVHGGHQLGFPLPAKAAYEIWVWEKLGRSAGFHIRGRASGTRAPESS